jgi:hypothetical protein
VNQTPPIPSYFPAIALICNLHPSITTAFLPLLHSVLYSYTRITNAIYPKLTVITCRAVNPRHHIQHRATILIPAVAHPFASITTKNTHHSHGRSTLTKPPPFTLSAALPSPPHTKQRHKPPRQSDSYRPYHHTQNQQTLASHPA